MNLHTRAIDAKMLPFPPIPYVYPVLERESRLSLSVAEAFFLAVLHHAADAVVVVRAVAVPDLV